MAVNPIKAVQPLDINTMVTDQTHYSRCVELLDSSEQLVIGPHRFVSLRHLAVTINKSWTCMMHYLRVYPLFGARFGWNWWSTYDNVLSWLVLYPLIVTPDRRNPFPALKAGKFTPQPPTIVVNDGKFFVTPLDLSRAFCCPFETLKTWLKSVNFEVTEVNEMTMINLALFEKAMASSVFSRRANSYFPAEVNCPSCLGKGYRVVRKTFDEPCERVDCAKCAGRGRVRRR